MPGGPSIGELEKMGVARASAGSAVMRATLSLVQRIGKELMQAGSCDFLFDGTLAHAELNRMLSRAAVAH